MEPVNTAEPEALPILRLHLERGSRKTNRVTVDHDWPSLSYRRVRSITGAFPGMPTLASRERPPTATPLNAR